MNKYGFNGTFKCYTPPVPPPPKKIKGENNMNDSDLCCENYKNMNITWSESSLIIESLNNQINELRSLAQNLPMFDCCGVISNTKAMINNKVDLCEKLIRRLE